MVQIHPSAQTTTDWKVSPDLRAHRGQQELRDLGASMEHKDRWALLDHKDNKDFKEQQGPWV